MWDPGDLEQDLPHRCRGAAGRRRHAAPAAQVFQRLDIAVGAHHRRAVEQGVGEHLMDSDRRGIGVEPFRGGFPVGRGGLAELDDAFVEELHVFGTAAGRYRSEEHTSELQSLMSTPYAVYCLKKQTNST